MKATQKIRIFERSNVRIITDMYIKFQSNWDVLRWKTVLKHDIMANTEKPEISSVVRWYHHYRNTWFPQESEALDCYHEFGNTFRNTCKPNGQIVGYLTKGDLESD